ncbi:hypothetical protein BDN71DRAFT_1360102, partial [Pleurotus eryngii]
QDDCAVAGLFSSGNISHAISQNFSGLTIYLFIIGELCDVYQSCTITHQQHLQMVLWANYFIKLWQQ